MRHLLALGLLVTLIACGKEKQGAVGVRVGYAHYVPGCLQVTVIDQEAPGNRAQERIRGGALRKEPRELSIAVYRGRDWSRELLVEVSSFPTADCEGPPVETRSAGPVVVPQEGHVESRVLLLARDADGDGHAERTGDIQGTDCDDARSDIHPGAPAVCEGMLGLGLDFNCDGKLDCNGSSCEGAEACGSGFCVNGICCDSACDAGSTQCTEAGSCGTGTCLYAPRTGLSCDDGSACTRDDRCDAEGACRGTARVCDSRPGPCHEETGTCDAATGECLYTVRTGASCDDGDVCTVDDVCGAEGTCAGRARLCNNPPDAQCYASPGTCDGSAGGCRYEPRLATTECDDGNRCTHTDRCDGQGTCAGQAVVCNTPGTCEDAPGTCEPLTGHCDYPLLPPDSACDDGVSCTHTDRCDGQGLCGGTAYTCAPPSACQKQVEACLGDGSCQYEPDPAKVGTACGVNGMQASCRADGRCSTFPYAPSNFDPDALSGHVIELLKISCSTEVTFDSSTGQWTLPAGCELTPPTLVTQPQAQGPEAVVLPMKRLEIDGGKSLRVVGSRPVIFAVYGDALVAGSLRADADFEAAGPGGNGQGCGGRTGGAGQVVAGQTEGSGGGGGGFGTAGAQGGTGGTLGGVTGEPRGAAGAALGSDTLAPLVGGCAGGPGWQPVNPLNKTGAGGGGGGAVQISAAGLLKVDSLISVSGGGGRGGGYSATGAGGGGGGGSGGGLLLEGDTLELSSNARLTANGGGGGEGGKTNNVAGNDGADGTVDTATTAPGGSGASNAGDGGGGGRVGSSPAVGANGGNGNGGGGGGGAVGVIRLRAGSLCTLDASCSNTSSGCIISPAASRAGQCAP